MSPPAPVVHTGFVWITVEEALLARVEGDRDLAKYLVARPAPGVLGCREKDRDRVLARLAKLGIPPRLVGGAA